MKEIKILIRKYSGNSLYIVNWDNAKGWRFMTENTNGYTDYPVYCLGKFAYDCPEQLAPSARYQFERSMLSIIKKNETRNTKTKNHKRN